MILQTDKRLNNAIQRSGCYLLSILFLINKHIGFMLSTVIINNIYDRLQEIPGWNGEPCLNHNCYVNDSEVIFKHLGLNVKYTNKHESPDYICKENELELLCWEHKEDEEKHHFTVGNGTGIETYNSMGKHNKDYYLKSKRIFILL